MGTTLLFFTYIKLNNHLTDGSLIFILSIGVLSLVLIFLCPICLFKLKILLNSKLIGKSKFVRDASLFLISFLFSLFVVFFSKQFLDFSKYIVDL